MPITYLGRDHRVVRYVQWAKLRRDEDDNVLGVLGVAFKLRPTEEYLSATWAEFFQCADCVIEAIKAIRASDFDVRPKSAFAVGVVDRIDAECRSRNRKIRFVHEEEPDNVAHAALRGWPRDDDELLERLAADAWSELIMNASIP